MTRNGETPWNTGSETQKNPTLVFLSGVFFPLQKKGEPSILILITKNVFFFLAEVT